MRIIPVIDLRGGRAVRGRRGERRSYLPVLSHVRGVPLEDLSDPVALAEAYGRAIGRGVLYIADLDRLEGTGCNDQAVTTLVAADLDRRILLDDGRPEAHEAPVSAANLRIDPIVSTETLGSLDQLHATPQGTVTGERILSLDLDASGLVARSSVIAAMHEIDLLREAWRRGVRRAILLSLDRVGTSGGLHRDRLSRLRDAVPDIDLMAGGGIAGMDDLIYLRKRGFSGALVASALHDGRLVPEDLRSAGFTATS